MANWTEILPQYGLIGILGKRGMGKTALAYYLSELRHELTGKPTAVLGPPASILLRLPEWFSIIDELDEVAGLIGYTILIDEGSMPLHIRRAMAREHIAFDQAISLCRHRNQLLIVCTHHSKKLDVLVIRDMDILAFKQPSALHTKMERGEIQDMSLKARNTLFPLKLEERKRHSYVMWDDFEQEGLVINSLPSFWSEELSTAVGMGAREGVDTMGVLVDTYRELHQVSYEAWDEIPKFRDCFSEAIGLLKPAFDKRPQFEPMAIERSREIILSAVPGAGPWAPVLLRMVSRLGHLTSPGEHVSIYPEV